MFRFVQTSNTGIVQTFGKLSRTCGPGLRFYVPILQQFRTVSNRIHQLKSQIEIKTKDNVFVTMDLAIQYQIKPENSAKAYFSLEDPRTQINAYVENTVRSEVPKMDLDDLFKSHSEISEGVNQFVNQRMSEFGYDIVNTLVVDITPSKEVKSAMNKINASLRLRDAARNEAEAEYIKEVKHAEADRDRKRLQGEGVSQQRQAIIAGYQEGIQQMADKLGISPKDVSDLVLKVQYMDMMEMVGKSPNAKVVYLDQSSDRVFRSVAQASESQVPNPAE